MILMEMGSAIHRLMKIFGIRIEPRLLQTLCLWHRIFSSFLK